MAAARKSKPDGGTAEVAAFLDALDHPLKPVLEAVRRSILAANPAIAEGIKWNAPSFRVGGWFATVNVRPRDGILVVLHLGAKARRDSALRASLRDPAALLTWMSEDRALVRFADAADFHGKRAEFEQVVRHWSEHQARLSDGAASDTG